MYTTLLQRLALLALAIGLAVVFYIPVQAQQAEGAPPAQMGSSRYAIPAASHLAATGQCGVAGCGLEAIYQDMFTSVGPPKEYLAVKAGKRAQTATFIVDYIGFEAAPDAQAAFQLAVDIWASVLTSEQPIRVQANWTPLELNVLGSASPAEVVRDFTEAPIAGMNYPIALAEKLARRPLNAPNAPDITCNFNSQFGWYLGLDANPPSGQFDFVTVVLHELGHGLGMTRSSFVNNAGVGFWGAFSGFGGRPVIYEQFLETSAGLSFLNDFPNNSTQLADVITGGQLFSDGPLIRGANGGLRARIFAPNPYAGGSSIAHLDEATYPPGNINSLMSPSVGAAEANHDPGPITLGIFSQMGWRYSFIDHEPYVDQDAVNTPFPVRCTLTSDIGLGGDLLLFYSEDGFLSDNNQLALEPVGGDEFEAVLPARPGNVTYSYYLQITDQAGNVVTLPNNQGGEQTFFSFNAGRDEAPPQIFGHARLNSVRLEDFDPEVSAIVTDNIGVQRVFVEYSVNDGPTQEFDLVNTSADNYRGSFPVETLQLETLDQIAYRIVAVDAASAQNMSFLPTSGDYRFALFGVVEEYASDFNDGQSDFISQGFQVTRPVGFFDNALHTFHPYANAPEGSSGRVNDGIVAELLAIVRISRASAFISYDEVVLVEPGTPGSNFQATVFRDYAIVEGSTDGGQNWVPIELGRDANDDPVWQTVYNDGLDAQGNSGSIGLNQHYRTRRLDLGAVFSIGDEVQIRFSLYRDDSRNGWGWAIDNLEVNGGASITSLEEELPTDEVRLSVYPSPAMGQGEQYLRLPTGLSAGTPLQVRILDLAGRQVGHQTYQAAAGQTAYLLPAPTLGAGTYLLEVSLPGQRLQTKFVRQ